MAIFHFSIEVLKRTEGKSAVSAAAWRANQKLFDNRLGWMANMPKDKRDIFKKILAPPSTPPDLLDRGVSGTLSKPRSASETLSSLGYQCGASHELTSEPASETAVRFATNELVVRDFIVDLTISSHQVEDITLPMPNQTTRILPSAAPPTRCWRW